MRTSAFRALWTTAWVLSACLLGNVASAQSSEPVYYYHTDGIGSVRMVTNEQGQVVERHDYQPFGVEVAPPASTERVRFAGKEHDPETGASGWMALDYFGARYLHSATGRFTSVDPLMLVDRNIADPQSWNRYLYVRNNPIRYVDPDGRSWWTKGIKLVVKGGDVAATFEGNLDDLRTLFGEDSSRWERFVALASLGSEVLPVSGRDIGDGLSILQKLPKPRVGRGLVPVGQRDPKRLFTKGDKQQGLDANGGTCDSCGVSLDVDDAIGHHKERHADGGKTVPDNRAVVCPECHWELHK